MIEALGEAILWLFQPLTMAIFLGVLLISLVIGVLPGIGVVFACAVALPFTFLLPMEMALLVLCGLSAAECTAGSISAILLNMPGTPSNAATLIDGFPMTQKGEGARAVGAAVTSSVMGSVLSIFMALMVIPVVLIVVMAFTSAEMSIVVMCGLVCIAFLTTGSTIKGLISGALGILASFVGMQVSTAIPRLTFDSVFLYDGFAFAPVALGLFAVAEMIDVLTKGQFRLSKVAVKAKLPQVWQGAVDWYRHKWMSLRSIIIGYIIGLIPIAGGAVSCFIAYAQAKQTSKRSEEFGTGIVEGVIAPESANNAVAGGSMLTTLCLGIPGNVTGIFYLAVMSNANVIPGPTFMTEHLVTGLVLLTAIAFGNIIAAGVGFFLTPSLVKLTQLNIHYLFPAVLALVSVGAFAAAKQPLDIVMLFVWSLLGLFMKRYGYNRPAFLLGFFLGIVFEKYVLIAYATHGLFFWTSPISLVVIALMIALALLPHITKPFRRSHVEGTEA